MLESLDLLSQNQLVEDMLAASNADISFECTQSFLQFLVGSIPRSTQFDTFGNDSYLGNTALCGFPLTLECNDSRTPPLGTVEQEEEQSDFFAEFDWQTALVDCCGIPFGFLAPQLEQKEKLFIWKWLIVMCSSSSSSSSVLHSWSIDNIDNLAVVGQGSSVTKKEVNLIWWLMLVILASLRFWQVSKSMAHTETLGTVGYIAPEYGSEGIVSTSGDVYSYGIMLMEVLSKRRPTDEEICNENLDLRKWITQAFPGTMMDIVDANLFSEEEQITSKTEICIASMIELALDCTKEMPESRITMKDVVRGSNTLKDALLGI
ncbi:hypothetical protein HAX54_052228 [Datura stramonium]|uniref:Protein kinase domain-containing protein n=1 Tax=Datura stramonium TaxID=4076 RepID=A0ABS8SZ68_DATST|nr:hypothetical protein [Datura stramonium]